MTESIRGDLYTGTPSHRTRRRTAFKLTPLQLCSIAAVLIGWEVAAQFVGPTRMPGFEDLPQAFKSLGYYWKGGFGVESTADGGPLTWRGAVYSLIYNTALTTARMAMGLLVGVGVGVGFAFLISWSRTLGEMFAFPAHLLRMTPLLAAVPLFELWFGANTSSAVIFIAFSVAILMFVIALNAIRNVPIYFEQYARSLGATRTRTYLTVIFPASLPQMRGGFLLAVGFAWSSAIAAELFGQPYGLGHIVVYAEFFSRVNVMGLAALLILIYAGVSYFLVSRLLNWGTRWAE